MTFWIVAVVGHATMIRPVYDNIMLLRAELHTKSIFFEQQSKAVEQVNELLLKYRGSESAQETISLSFPQGENTSSLLGQLRTLADLNALSLEIFGIKPLAVESLSTADLVKPVGTLQVTLKMLGSYESLKGFLRAVETNIRLMDIQQVNIERIVNPENDFFAYTVIINTYYQTKK